MQSKGAFGVYTHSEASRSIVKSMIVGWMQGQEAVADVTTTILCKYHLNKVTATFVMNS